MLRITFLVLFFSLSAWSQVLYVTLSDSHSNYTNLPKFLFSLETEVEHFKTQHPTGRIVLLINGDYGGTSGLASVKLDGRFEGGVLGHNVLTDLAKLGVDVVFNSGNHEAHDFATLNKTNQMYIEQMQHLHQASSRIHLLGTNTNFTQESGLNSIFAKNYDVENGGEKTRILGLTLQDLETKSTIYAKEPLYTTIRTYQETLEKEVALAIQEGVSKMTIMIHDGTPSVLKVAEVIETQFAGRMKFNSWHAAHDHVEALEQTARGTPVLNAGSQFGYIKWEEHNNQMNQLGLFSMQQYEHFETMPRIQSHENIAVKIGDLARTTFEKVEKLKEALRQKKYRVVEIRENKLTMKKSEARSKLGLSLANAMRDWAKHGVQADYKNLPTLGIFNTSSYRLDTSPGKIMLTELEILEMHPFNTTAKMHALSGSQVLEILQKTIRFQENLNSMQMSDNLRLLYANKIIKSGKSGREKIIKFPTGLEFKNSRDQWVKVNGNDKFLVGLDAWTSENGYGLDYSSKYLKENFKNEAVDLTRAGSVTEMPEILRKYLPRHLMKKENSDLLLELNSRISSEVISIPPVRQSLLGVKSTAVKVLKCSALFL